MSPFCRRLTVAPVFAILALGMATFAPAALADMNGPDGIAALNRMRAANGIPAVTEDPFLSDACAKHDVYMSLNHSLDHAEVEGKPGYTTQGASIEHKSAIAGSTTSWGVASPWGQSPFHLAWILNPAMKTAGFYQKLNYSCLALDTLDLGSANAIYTYPGDGATAVDPSWDTSYEWPSPNEAVELKRDKITGTNLVVMADGPWSGPGTGTMQIVSASLAPADGTGSLSAVRLIQNDKCGNECGIIIPVNPLKGGTRYHASVTVDIGGTRVSHDWFFTTIGSAQQPPSSNGTIASLALSKSVVRATQLASVKVSYFYSGDSFFGTQILRADLNGVFFDGKCYPPSQRSMAPKAPKCTSWISVRKTSGRTTGGAHATALSALLGPVKLTPGSYRLVLRGDVGSKTAPFTVQP
jgi:hypothetical protein